MKHRHPYEVGDVVMVGKGVYAWRITGFFGEFADIASLTRVDRPDSNSSAHFGRLNRVTP